MKLIGLNNNPEERRKVTYPYVYWDRAFSENELKEIVFECEKALEPASTLGPTANYRSSNIRFIKPEATVFNRNLFQRLNDTLTMINNSWYGFELNGFDGIQYTTYTAEQEGHYDWHMDICLGDQYLPVNMWEPRKLSMSLLLNDDFEGGEFQINLGNESDAVVALKNEKGRIIAFPSFMIHRVLPVTKGIRKSMVVWVTGPKFT